MRATSAPKGLLLSLLLALPLLTLARPAHADPSRRPTPTVQPIAPPQARPDSQPSPIWSDASGEWRQTGIASWYGGKRWQGRRTASGAIYDDRRLTAAHASLPLGSRVLVLVPATGRSVVVTITDRPGTRTRIIDLSRAAAARLGIISRGIAKVTLAPG